MPNAATVQTLVNNVAMKRISFVGRRFGRLFAFEDGPHQGKRTTSKCRCDCGTTVTVSNSNLYCGHTTSCGCFAREQLQIRSVTHGQTRVGQHSRVYHVWSGMIQRCTNPSCKHYINYGGRGISVCQEWMQFENFFADMGPGKKGWTIERIDNNKGYSLWNCCWGTPFKQAGNKRTSRIYTVRGVTDSLKALCRRFGVRYLRVWYRLERGLSIEEALFNPVERRARPVATPTKEVPC